MDNDFYEILFKNFSVFVNDVAKEIGLQITNKKTLKLKIKLVNYKDPSQIFKEYQNLFSPEKISISKKKSGTILIIWTLLKYAQRKQLSIDNMVCYINFFIKSFFFVFLKYMLYIIVI